MDINALLYYKSADDLKFSTSTHEYIDGFEIKLGKQRYFFRGGETPFNCGSSISIATNKYCMNKRLEDSGFPVPKATALSKAECKEKTIEALIADLNFPLVVKPTRDTALGLDVICNITDIDQLKTHLKTRFRYHTFLSVEEFHPNLNSYRVLVFYNKVIGVVQRFPAQVVGDGVHSIKELIAINNVLRKKLKETVSLGPIKVDEEYQIRLKELNMTLDTIPQDKETVTLCYTCNSSRGGTMKSLGKKICKENAQLLCQAAKTLNLNIVGFDVICEDILIPLKASRGVIIEANHNPDISIHENPIAGIQNRVSKKILRQLMMRHPLSYFVGLCYNKQSGFYIKFSLLVSILLTYKLLS
jgi:D-alanine-D-alanine ligase-like ATP-grasp enzyme